MANSNFSSKRSSGKPKKIYSQYRIDHAAYAFDHLSDMVNILRYHTEEQKSAVETGTPPSSKDSQTLMKTLLSAFKQMDHYLEIIDPPMQIADEQEAETQTEPEILDETTGLSNRNEELDLDPAREENPKMPFAQTIYSELPFEEFPIQIGDGEPDQFGFHGSHGSADHYTRRYKRR